MNRKRRYGPIEPRPGDVMDVSIEGNPAERRSETLSPDATCELAGNKNVAASEMRALAEEHVRSWTQEGAASMLRWS